ncbi:MAG: phage head-tail connector protein, partial [Porphyrobacter sp.]|nr:phage head-tail connector protein [Porphyrobacter sp.]
HRKVESELGYPILQQTRQTHLSGFPSRGGRHPFFGAYGPVWTAPHGPIWLGGGDSLNVIQVQYYDADGVQQTLDPAAYVLDAVSRPARIVPAPDTGWPETQYRPGAVTIDWQAGWASAADVPDDLIHAMKLLVGHWDQNREGVAVDVRGTPAELPLAFDELLRPYRLPFVA